MKIMHHPIRNILETWQVFFDRGFSYRQIVPALEGFLWN